MKIEQPAWKSELPKDVQSRLDHLNRRTTEGSDQVLIADPLMDTTDDNLVDQVEDVLSRVVLTPKLREIEDSARSKLGPRSIAKPWEERKESLYEYFQHQDFDPGNFDEDVLHQADARYVPASQGEVTGNLLKSSSAGLPYMRRKGLVLNDAAKRFPELVWRYPCVLYTRTQEDRKTRNVWGFGIGDTMAEQRFFIPWIRHERTLDWRAALLGPDDTDRAVTDMLRAKPRDAIMQGVDFSSYDATVSPALAHRAFSSISKAFQVQHRDGLYGVYRRFVSIPIYTPAGEVTGAHGVPSGSSFTNTIDSFVQHEVASSVGFHKCQIQGDDGIYSVSESARSDFLAAFKDAGLRLNEDKSDVFDGSEAVYLQRYYHPNYSNADGTGYGGVYSLLRATSRLKYLERWTDFEEHGITGDDFYSLRAIMILENCKHHPGFEPFVKLVQSWDKNQLRFSRSGAHQYSKMMMARSRAGLFGVERTFASGLSSFATVRVLNQ